MNAAVVAVLVLWGINMNYPTTEMMTLGSQERLWASQSDFRDREFLGLCEHQNLVNHIVSPFLVSEWVVGFRHDGGPRTTVPAKLGEGVAEPAQQVEILVTAELVGDLVCSVTLHRGYVVSPHVLRQLLSWLDDMNRPSEIRL